MQNIKFLLFNVLILLQFQSIAMFTVTRSKRKIDEIKEEVKNKSDDLILDEALRNLDSVLEKHVPVKDLNKIITDYINIKDEWQSDELFSIGDKDGYVNSNVADYLVWKAGRGLIKIKNLITGQIKEIEIKPKEEGGDLRHIYSLSDLRFATVEFTEHFNYRIKIWDIITGQCLKVFNVEEFNSLCVLQNKLIVGGSREGSVKIWNLNTNNLLFNFKALEHSVNMVLPYKGDKFIYAGYNGTRICNSRTGENIKELYSGYLNVNILPNGKLILGYYNGMVRIFNFETDKFELEFQAYNGEMKSIFVISDRFIALSKKSEFYRYDIWDLKTQKKIATINGFPIALLKNGSFLSINKKDDSSIYHVDAEGYTFNEVHNPARLLVNE